MTDIERDFERAETYVQGKSRNGWALALIASRVVGRNIPGATAQLAQLAGVESVDAVEHWAKAWRLYDEIRHVAEYVDYARLFRREFTISHFKAAADLRRKHDLTLGKIMIAFLGVWDYKRSGERWGVSVLEREIEAHVDGEKKAADWRWYWSRLANEKELTALLSFDGEVPDEIKQWAKRGLELRHAENKL